MESIEVLILLENNNFKLYSKGIINKRIYDINLEYIGKKWDRLIEKNKIDLIGVV